MSKRAATYTEKVIALQHLLDAWNELPELRLGQLIVCASTPHEPFYVEDDELIEQVKKLAHLGEPC